MLATISAPAQGLHRLLILAGAWASALGSCSSEAIRWPADQPAEGAPASRLAARHEREVALGAPFIEPTDSARIVDLRSALGLLRAWNPGQVLVVAFQGGSDRSRQRTARAAGYWAARVNLRFDFGDDSGRGFHTWAKTDTAYAAHIRVQFDTGVAWSEVGTDAVDAAIAPPGAASMTVPVARGEADAGWDAAVRHLFGHAIGLASDPIDPADGLAEYPNDVDLARRRQARKLQQLRQVLDRLQLDAAEREPVEAALDSARAAQELINQRLVRKADW